ncbi:MAG: MgtC/SapB family protein [Chloroflexi bacterium]|nr:MgtC/SapB family protein [Chloroflexota bacterium]
MEALSLSPFVTGQDLELAIRLLLAFLLGAAVGYERERQRRPAGLRTHMLVAGGAAAFTLASAHGFGTAGVDSSRIAAQVVAGVGFLGAGTILRTRSSVSGLTTASSIWLVAAVGLLVGAGLYFLAALATLFGWATLFLLKMPERRLRLGEPSLAPEEGEELED